VYHTHYYLLATQGASECRRLASNGEPSHCLAPQSFPTNQRSYVRRQVGMTRNPHRLTLNECAANTNILSFTCLTYRKLIGFEISLVYEIHRYGWWKKSHITFASCHLSDFTCFIYKTDLLLTLISSFYYNYYISKQLPTLSQVAISKDIFFQCLYKYAGIRKSTVVTFTSTFRNVSS